eukprot:1190399-Prorocentrum_minimum.AAC.3
MHCLHSVARSCTEHRKHIRTEQHPVGPAYLRARHNLRRHGTRDAPPARSCGVNSEWHSCECHGE